MSKINELITKDHVYYLFPVFMLLMISCHNPEDDRITQITGSWERYNYMTVKPNILGEYFTNSYNDILHFDNDGKGNKIQKDITVMNNGESSSYIIEYPFTWILKKDGQENYVEIKYLQGNIKSITGKNKDEQEQKAQKDMLETSGSTETNYFHIADHKLIFHEKGDTATWYYTRKTE